MVRNKKNIMPTSAYFMFSGLGFGLVALCAELWRKNVKPKAKPKEKSKLIVLDDNCHGYLLPQKPKIRTVCYVIWINLILGLLLVIIGFFLW